MIEWRTFYIKDNASGIRMGQKETWQKGQMNCRTLASHANEIRSDIQDGNELKEVLTNAGGG